MVQNIALGFCELLASVCQIEMLETLVSLMFTLNVKTALLFDALQQQMSLIVILIYRVFHDLWTLPQEVIF